MPPPSQTQRPPSPSLEELAELPQRVARLEAEVTELRETLRALEPGGCPLTVRQFCERFGWSENQLRWLLFNRHEKGLAEAVSGRAPPADRPAPLLQHPEVQPARPPP